MTFCWSDSKSHGCGCLPLGPLAILICLLILVLVCCDLSLSLYADRLTFDNAFTALRIIADAVSGSFAVAANLGIVKMDPTLTRAGAYAIYPLIFLIIVSLGVQWVASLAADDLPGAYWRILTLVSIADLVLLGGLLYSIAIFKRLTLYFEHEEAKKIHRPYLIVDPETGLMIGATHNHPYPEGGAGNEGGLRHQGEMSSGQPKEVDLEAAHRGLEDAPEETSKRSGHGGVNGVPLPVISEVPYYNSGDEQTDPTFHDV